MIPLFQNDNILDIDIIALQEPWRNTRDQTTYHPRKDAFHLIYPESNKARVCFFINKKIEKSVAGNRYSLTVWLEVTAILGDARALR